MDSSLGIVSPCSTCKNQRSVAEDGKPNICPRRNYQKRLEALQQADKPDPDAVARLQMLVQTGTEDDSLKNPVYWDSGKSILVWVARLLDNPSLSTAQPPDGNGFDTDRIRCHPLPYLVGCSEVEYFQRGALKEWQPLRLTSLPAQIDSTTQCPADVAGTVERTSLLYKSPRTPVVDHEAPEGC